MAAQFKQEVLKVVVAQICQVIGFQGIYSVPLEVLVDLMHRYILKIAVNTKKYAEHCGRSEPILQDLQLSFKDIGVSLSDLEDYINHVDSDPYPHQIPQIPIPRPSNMNFLKPGSKETLSRPIHIHEYLPPMHPEKEEEDDANLSTNDSFDDDQIGGIHSPLSSYNDKYFNEGDNVSARRGRNIHQEEGQPVREIDSVMMTTSGFISSARAGKMPEGRRPNIGLPSVQRDSFSSSKKKATLEKIIRHKSQLGGIQPGPLAKPQPKETKLKPKLPGAPPGTGSLKTSKVAPILKMPTPKKMEENIDKDVDRSRRERRDEHRHKDRRRDRDRSRENDAKYRGRMRMRGLSKEEELRRYKQREQELIAALAASASVTVTSIPPPSLRVREKTPEKGSPIKSSPGNDSPDSKKLDLFKKVKVKEPEQMNSPSSLIDIQNIKEEKLDEDEYPVIPTSNYMGFDPLPPPLVPETPGKCFFEKKIESTIKRKPKTSSGKGSKRHSKGSKRRKSTFSETSSYSSRTAEDSHLEMKSPPREFTYPNAPSHIPSFSSFSYPNFGPPLADIKPFANVYPDHSFNSPLPVHEDIESNVTPHRECDEFDQRLEMEQSYFEEPPEPIPKVITSLPKLEKKREQKREHKRDKKSKEREMEREKAKKKKKDKERAKEVKKKEKERLKEAKRRKKKEKEESGAVPKITLKLQPEETLRPPSIEPKSTPKLVIKPVIKRPEEVCEKSVHYSSFSTEDEPGSPEIAKFSALITRPSKSSSKKHLDAPIVKPLKIKDAVKKSEKKEKKKHFSEKLKISIAPTTPSFTPVSPERSSTRPVKKQAAPSTALLTETVGPIGCFKDDQGNAVWICPTCGKQDDGSPMIGCDACDDWYHWVCVGIQVAPNENVNWYCPRCILHQKNRGGTEKKKRGRKRKLI